MINLDEMIEMRVTLGKLIRYLNVPVAKLVDVNTPRSDGRPIKPTNITLGKTYPIMGIVNDRLDPLGNKLEQIIIINDHGKLSRHSRHRFEIIEVDATL